MCDKCPKCGYERIPEATHPPTFWPVANGKWAVGMWTLESGHRWIKDDFPDREAAKDFIKTVRIVGDE